MGTVSDRTADAAAVVGVLNERRHEFTGDSFDRGRDRIVVWSEHRWQGFAELCVAA